MVNKKRDRASKKWMVSASLVSILMIVLVSICVVFYAKNTQTLAAISTNAANTDINVNETIGGKGSVKYNENLMTLGAEESERAKKNGENYIPPIVQKIEGAQFELEDPEEEVVKLPKQPVVINLPTKSEKPYEVPKIEYKEPVQQAPVEVNPREEILKNAIMAELGFITEKLMPGYQSVEIFRPVDNTFAVARNGKQEIELPAERIATYSIDFMNQFGVRPGDVFYAENETLANSDVLSPIGTAMILSGPLKGARSLGQFQKQGDYLVFQYSILTLKDGRRFSMTGYAVDPKTKSIGVRSNVDYHYLLRWGGLIASSFLEGFGEAVKKSGSATLVSGVSGTTTHVTPEYNMEDQTWIAAGKVGERLSDKAIRDFDKESTVILKNKQPIGIMIIDIKEAK